MSADYGWRLFGTGIGFFLFGAGGAVLFIVVFPFVFLFIRSPQKRQSTSRIIIQKCFSVLVKFLIKIGLISLDIEEGISLTPHKKGMFIISNHPSLLDVVIIMSVVPNLQCIVKGTLWKNPFVGGVVRAAGYIANDLPVEKFLKVCKFSIERGENILIFPEGTRSIPFQPLNIQRSLAHLSMEIRADVQALIMTCKPATLLKGQKWYRISKEKPNFRLASGKVFYSREYLDESIPRPKRARRFTNDIQGFYNERLGL